jgi:hypothetical protein
MSLKIRLIILFSALSLANLLAQNPKKHTISGYVKDDSSGEYLIGASVYLKETFQGVSTNTYGFYSLTVPEGEYTVVVSYLGFDEYTQKINLNKDFRINVSLKMKVMETKVFEIVDERIDKNVKSTDMGRVELNVEEMKKLPAFMGEVDVIKIVQLIPGIKSAGEGNTGFYVRGGGPDQNLVLLDEAIVYNAAHLFGFFSVFNPDAIKGVDVHKGGMPAQYGGRLASVLDIQMKEGNNKNYKVDGGIGLIASRLTVQGPIKKDTSSFIISGRRTYLDVLAQPFVSKESPFKGSGYYFYDLNTKINYRLSDKDRLFLSGYFGRDVFTFKNENSGFDIRIPWGNATASARWNHLFNDKLFLNTSLIFSDYQFESNIEQSAFKFGVFSGIRDYNAKMDFSYFPNIRHQIKFGANYIYHRFTPNNASAELLGTEFDLGEEERLYAHESAIYVSDDFDVTDKFRIHFGLRGSSFTHVGPFTRYVKNEAGETVDEIKYNRGDKIKQYNRVEPRLMMRYSLDMKSSIKASYTQNYQYLHLTSFANVSLPTDIWIPSTSLVEPQFGQQYSLGYYRNLKQNMFETSAEVYYKRLENQVEFKDGTLQQDQVKDNLDNSLTFGSGRAYGIELFAKKALGKTTGWVGYTLSYTTRIFPELNLGESFFARYDRRHDISVVANHELTKKWTLAAIFVYSSGNLLWMPTSQYFFEGNFVAQYDTRNNFRMPAYHRLDLSATYIAKDTPKYKSSWNISIYNVYSRLNPYFIYIDTSGNPVDGTLKAQAKMVSLFPIIPSVTYNFSF